MKKILLCLIFFGCTSPKPNSQALDYDQLFQGKDACFLLYDLTQDKMVEVYNSKRCQQREVPCSTFKVPLAVMAFEAGILKDENTLFKWDKRPQILEAWNKDHTAKSWMQDSVVWYSQRITPLLGRKKITDNLKKFLYGNADFSGDIDSAWLSQTPFAPNRKVSLQISAMEQVEFFKKLWRLELPTSRHAQIQTKKILVEEPGPSGYVLRGKTGSGYSDFKNNKRLGWYVVHIQAKEKEYISVVTFNDLEPQSSDEFASIFAKKALKEILKNKSL